MATNVSTASLLRQMLADPNHVQVLQTVKDRCERVSALHKAYQLATYGSVDAVKEAFTWSEPVKGYSVLIWRDSKETVELDVAGIITDVFLGPVRKDTKFTAKEDGAQRLSMEAPGDPAFANALLAVDAIYWSAEQHGRENDMGQGPPTGDAITATSRFLTTAKYNAFGSPITTFRYPEIDPDGRLQNLVKGGKFVYTEDNIVDLYDAEWLGTKKIEVKTNITPSKVRRGQAAEVSVSFATVTAGSSRSFIIKLNQTVVFDRTGSMLLERRKREYAASTLTNHHEARIPSRKRKQDMNQPEIMPSKRARNTVMAANSPAGDQAANQEALSQLPLAGHEAEPGELNEMGMLGIEEGPINSA